MAVDSWGNIFIADTNDGLILEAQQLVDSVSVTVAVAIPGAPTGLTARDDTTYPNTQIDLSWTAPSGTVSGYLIFRGTTPGGESSTPLGSQLQQGTTYRDSTCTPA